MAAIKGPGEAQKHDGSSLRIAIVHARWNAKVIDALVTGCKQTLLAAGVKEQNIIVQNVPGSYELPFAVQQIYTASQIQSSTTGAVSATDLLSSMADLSTAAASTVSSTSSSSFDAIIAIGVLIKGETMHFEYIAEATSHALMKVQLDSKVPVIFGLLTVLNEEQAMARAGIDGKGHNHGEDWASAAVELGMKTKAWAEGKMI
ncbi:MAG: hypothetical protein MMC33_000502 [Icmadophila ericetorum]|nr:hypothetical protein [Icmadophila ericetorum]